MNTENQTGKSKLLKRILIILVIAIIVIIGIIVSFSFIGKPCDKTNNSYKTVKIKENYSDEEIAETLEQKGIIEDSRTFLALSGLYNHDEKYKPGTYYLSPSMNFRTIANTMLNGISTDSGFTIPGGYTVEQTASSLEQAGFCTKQEFLDAASAIDLSMYDFIDPSLHDASKLEGFLLPGQYKIDREANADMIIITMLNEFDNFFNDEYRAMASELGLSVKDVVVIASIIEKETSQEKYKAKISSVIHNKLNLNSEFEGGYPNIPLCSPSGESIKAALYPEETQYLYYVPNARLDGSLVFTSDRKQYYSLRDAYDAAVAEKNAAKKEKEAEQ